jgi:hypothetical protein
LDGGVRRFDAVWFGVGQQRCQFLSQARLAGIGRTAWWRAKQIERRSASKSRSDGATEAEG